MAEVLGAVASGMGVAAFAVQIGASVQRLVAMWKSIRNAPQHIHDLLVEIEVLAEILADFETAQLAGHSVAHTPPSRRALLLCKRVAEDLRNVLDKFDTVLGPSSSKCVKQRTWTAVKAAFRKPEMQEQLERLQRAKMNLVIAGQCSSIAQMAAFRLDQAAENEHLRALISGLTNDTRASTAGDRPRTPAIRWTSSTGRFRDVSIKVQLVHRSYWTPFGPIQYRSSSEQKQTENVPSGGCSSWSYWPSSWTFLKHGLEILGDRSLGRPQFVFRAFRIVPNFGDPAFSAVATGDFLELKRLCDLGQASPFDRNEAGLSLLHVAVMSDRPEICSWLVEHGVFADEMMKGKRFYSPPTLFAHPDIITFMANPEPMSSMLRPESFLSQPQSERVTSLLSRAKKLLYATEMDTSLIKLSTAVAEHPSIVALKRVHDYAIQVKRVPVEPFTTWSICQGVPWIFHHLWTHFESLIGDHSSQSHRDCVLREILNFNMLCTAATLSYRELDWLAAVQTAQFLCLNLPAHDLLHERPEYDEEKDCCHSRLCQGTPLLWIFMGFLILKSQNHQVDHAHRCVKTWLSALRVAGIDLSAYLRTARSAVLEACVKNRAGIRIRLRFKFGDSDEDHRVWANYKITKLSQQNTEGSAAQMPGGWKDYNEWDAIEPSGTIGKPVDIDSGDDDSDAWWDGLESEYGGSDAWDDELESEDAYRDDWDFELEPEVEEEAEVS